MDQPKRSDPSRRRATLFLVVGAILVAGVGGGVIGVLLAREQEPRTGTGPSPTPIATPPSPEPVSTQTMPPPRPLSTETFIMPSRNIGCGFFEALRCDILSGLNPTPTGDCELDWTGLTLEPEGNAAPQCAGDTVFDPQAPILEYGQTWSLAGIRCESRQTGLRCTNTVGHGFELARANWDTF
jgi:hypothetical protein